MTPVRFDRRAREEFGAAVAYYEQQQTGLGKRFLSTVEDAIRKIQRQPHIYRELEGDVRKARVFRFPYAIIFRARPGALEIIAVMHLHRRPDYWRDRNS